VAQAPGLSVFRGPHRQACETALRRLEDAAFQRRLLEKDPSLWNGDPDAIRGRLGWAKLPETMQARLPELRSLAGEVRESGFRNVVLLGMGGSSLAPEVIYGAFGATEGYPSLLLLDTTDPATIDAAERSLDLERTLFIVSSKSGTTVETASLYRYFAEKLGAEDGARDNFIAITDAGTPLERLGKSEGFRRVLLNDPDVGGRFSALSFFGLAPAAAIGVDVGGILESARSLDVRSGIELGATLGALALSGRDKVTFFASRSLRDFVAWAEQLLAESTGKLGKGIVPVDLEPPGAPDVYGGDRVIVYLRLHGETGPDAEVRALAAAGHPVITITLGEKYDLGAEFLRWEIATAAAGHLLAINPFDEPNVAEAKERTTQILREGVRAGHLADDGLVRGTDGKYRYSGERVRGIHGPLEGVGDLLGAGMYSPGDYFALLAFIPRTPEHDQLLTRLRVALRDRTKLATSVGYGPRYLHSTGQLFKGGPDKGVFVQIVAEDATDLEIPGEEYTFGVLKRAQALGDLQALESRGRRVVRFGLGADPAGGLRAMAETLEGVLLKEDR
jgi:glucose-6-phosphate isomerase